jgi:hypothetical protein
MKGSNSSQCVCKMHSTEAGGKEFQEAQLPVSPTYLGLVEVRAIISQTVLSELLIPLSPSDAGSVAALRALLHALPTPTATLSTLSTLTRLLLLYTAYSIGASHLVLGTSLTSLSISLISSIAQGGGFVVPQSIQEEWIPPFVERVPGDSSWNGEVRLVRPLRDVSMKECQAWVWWRQLPVVGKQRIPIPKQTIGHLTKGRHIYELLSCFLRLTNAYRIYHWTRERLPFDGLYHRQNRW